MTRYIEQADQGPLCPRSGPDKAPEHEIALLMLNAMYDVIPKDADGEMSADMEAVYRAAESAASVYMRLYKTISAPSILGQGKTDALARVTVEAWFFECPTCHFILPAVGRTPSQGV